MAKALRAGALALVLGGVMVLVGCELLAQYAKPAGEAVGALAGPIGAVNPVVGLVMTAVGALLTGVGEAAKKAKGR